jgi:hypothetical protein
MEKILEKLPLMVVAVFMVIFGLIACFANTQSIVSILLAGTLSSLYAVRAGGLENFGEDLEKLFSGELGTLKSCVMIMDLALEMAMVILTVVSIVGLINGRIEANFINIFLPSWVMFMIIASIILFIIIWKWYRDEQETEEEEYLEESEEEF